MDLKRRIRTTRKIVAVMLTALGSVLVFSSAAQAQSLEGGCTGTVNGKALTSMTKDNPLVVKKGQKINVSGTVPGTSTATRSSTTVSVGGLLDFGPYRGKGTRWGKPIDVPSAVFNLTSGIYPVEGYVVGSGFECYGSGYIKIQGNALGEFLGGLTAAAGGLGLTMGGRKPGKNRDLQTRLGLEELLDDIVKIARDARAQGIADALTAIIAFLFVLFLFRSTDIGAVLMPVFAVAAPAAGRERVWIRGRPIRGFIGGLLAGLGIFLLGFGLEMFVFDFPLLLALPGGMAVIGLVRALVGTPFFKGGARASGPPSAAPSGPPTAAPPAGEASGPPPASGPPSAGPSGPPSAGDQT